MKFSKSVTWGLVGVGLAALVAACSANPVGTQEAAISPEQPSQAQWSMDDEKRAWENLHGGWGKRRWPEVQGFITDKRAWNNLHGGWGKRGWQDMSGVWGKRAWNNLHGGWGKRAWSNLHGGWGKRDSSDLLDYLAANQAADQDYYEIGPFDSYAPLRQVFNSNFDKVFDDNTEQDVDKRAWSSLHQSWGKRSGQKWNNLRGAWGKREPGWNNLKGLWGKRSNVDSITDDSQSAFLDRPDE